MTILDQVTEEEIVNLVTQLVGIESHKLNEKRESAVANWIAHQFKVEGIASLIDVVEENRPNVYGIIEGKTEGIKLMLNGHIDTVPGFKMNYDPFKPFIKDGNIYGRGTADMKGAIAAMMAALIGVKRSGVNLEHSVMFAGVIDEEERSKGSELLIRKTINPEYVVIGEPTKLEVAVAHKGMEWVEVKFCGIATHGSRPKEGINAIYAAGYFCDLVRESLEPAIEMRTFPLLGNGTINIGKINGGDDPNIVPDECRIEIDRRWLPNETLEAVHQEIEKTAKKAGELIGAKVEVRAMRELTSEMINAPFSLSPEDEFVKTVCNLTETITGNLKKPIAFPAWSDAGILGVHTNAKCLILGPGDIVQAHANDEFCSLKQIIEAAEIYYQLILNRCQ